jgi:hypothetical protein
MLRRGRAAARKGCAPRVWRQRSSGSRPAAKHTARPASGGGGRGASPHGAPPAEAIEEHASTCSRRLSPTRVPHPLAVRSPAASCGNSCSSAAAQRAAVTVRYTKTLPQLCARMQLGCGEQRGMRVEVGEGAATRAAPAPGTVRAAPKSACSPLPLRGGEGGGAGCSHSRSFAPRDSAVRALALLLLCAHAPPERQASDFDGRSLLQCCPLSRLQSLEEACGWERYLRLEPPAGSSACWAAAAPPHFVALRLVRSGCASPPPAEPCQWPHGPPAGASFGGSPRANSCLSSDAAASLSPLRAAPLFVLRLSSQL